MNGKVYVGTSGWMYKDWAREFYPAEVPARGHLEYYATQFPTVEINASFYRLPTPEAIRGWHRQAPKGFLFAVKGSKAVTHFKKLLPGAKSFPLLLREIAALRNKLGPVLWQLPGHFRKNAARLEEFCRTLPREMRHAVEFRDPSWLDDEIFAILRRHRVANVALSSEAMPVNQVVTARFAYVRFHGLQGGASHDYTRAELEPWAEFLRQTSRRGIRSYVYFNNDVNVRAPGNARMLMEMLGPLAAPPAGRLSRLSATRSG